MDKRARTCITWCLILTGLIGLSGCAGSPEEPSGTPGPATGWGAPSVAYFDNGPNASFLQLDCDISGGVRSISVVPPLVLADGARFDITTTRLDLVGGGVPTITPARPQDAAPTPSARLVGAVAGSVLTITITITGTQTLGQSYNLGPYTLRVGAAPAVTPCPPGA